MTSSQKIKQILELSKQLGTDSNKLMEMMQEHTAEIKELFDKKEGHYAIETGDLIILAYQLLMINGQDPERVLEECYQRYDKKLKGLIKSGA